MFTNFISKFKKINTNVLLYFLFTVIFILIGILFYKEHNIPRIVIFDTTSSVETYLKETVGDKKVSDAELKQITNQYINSTVAILYDYVMQNNLIVLYKNSVFGGATDITGQIEQKRKELEKK